MTERLADIEVAPSRGRGLKPLLVSTDGEVIAVAPSRGRGLKRYPGDQVPGHQPSPLRGGVD